MEDETSFEDNHNPIKTDISSSRFLWLPSEKDQLIESDLQ